MLCDVCHLIFQGGAQARGYKLENIGVEQERTTRYTHHATTQSLVDSVKLCCYICTAVWKDALSHGFTSGPHLRWQRSCSTSYILQTFDRQMLSASSLELLIGYARKRRIIIDGPGADEIVFFTKFALEPVKADDLEKPLNRQSFAESTGSASALDLASKWISDCSQNHAECIQPGSIGKQLPTRLINVGAEGSPTVHLYEGNDLLYETNDLFHSVTERYMTLSHCWGNANIFTLNKSTYSKLKAGISVSDLPQTFQDAIYVTRRLRVKYLWIDSLCILQDDVDDWRRESSAMTRIYRQALCNIAALASSTSNGGCFRERDVRSIQPNIVNARWVGLPKGPFNIYHEKLWERDVAKAPLHKRAWVVQERLLAPRVLQFGREQLFWECHRMNACETYPDGMPQCLTLTDSTVYFKGLDPSVDGEKLRKMSNWDSSDLSLNQLYIWAKVVRAYTGCFLTNGLDKLVAISGIAKMVQPLSLSDFTSRGGKLPSCHPAKYLAGLWSYFLPAQLLWEVKQGSRSATYRAPTWSWASLDGQVSFQTPLSDGQDLIYILSATTSPFSEDSFGQVTGGFIQLQGNLVPVTMTAMSRHSGAEMVVATINGQSISTLCRPDVVDNRLPERLYCLPIRSFRYTNGGFATQRLGCLILEPTGISNGEYRRWAQMSLENDIDRRAVDKRTRLNIVDYQEFDDRSGRYTITIV